MAQRRSRRHRNTSSRSSKEFHVAAAPRTAVHSADGYRYLRNVYE